jgi:hypothetical protein
MATTRAGYCGTPQQEEGEGEEEWTKVANRRKDKDTDHVAVDEEASPRELPGTSQQAERREKRLLLIYLHDRNSPACHSFCTQVSEPVPVSK